MVCDHIQGEMMNQTSTTTEGLPFPRLDRNLPAPNHPLPGVNGTYQELLKVINFFRAPLYGIHIQVTNEHTS